MENKSIQVFFVEHRIVNRSGRVYEACRWNELYKEAWLIAFLVVKIIM